MTSSLPRGFAFVALFLLLVGAMPAATAQEATSPAAPAAKKVEYFDAHHKPLSSADGADYRVETIMRDSVAGTERVYYSSGKLKKSTPYGHLRLRIEHGVKTTWYETGQMRSKEDYVAGKRHGDLLVYYPNGTLRRRDKFERDQRTAGECFGSEGQPIPYFEYLIMPVYSEGAGDNASVVAAIQRRTKYPTAAMRIELNACIFIGFTVTKTGAVSNVRVEREPAPAEIPPAARYAFATIKESALSAARQLHAFKPAQFEGEPVLIGYTVPITFRMQ